jgi:lactoylglutathione lyase
MPRFLHTSIFVNDMAESIAFYTERLGMNLLGGPYHYPGNANMAFVGRDWTAYIELVHDLEEHPPYALGNRFEHLAIEIETDVPLERFIADLKSKGVKILRDVYKAPTDSRAIAFIEDPNGIPLEVLEPR